MDLSADALAADQALKRPAGVSLTITLQLLDAGVGVDELADRAVYLWHCGRDGLYSLCSNGFGAHSYLRGLQQADHNGAVTFHGMFPACYAGNMPHIYLEVYPSLARSGSAAKRIHSIAFTFPLSTLREAYACPGYEQSARNLAKTSSQSYANEPGVVMPVAAVSGNAIDGYAVALRVPVVA